MELLNTPYPPYAVGVAEALAASGACIAANEVGWLHLRIDYENVVRAAQVGYLVDQLDGVLERLRMFEDTRVVEVEAARAKARLEYSAIEGLEPTRPIRFWKLTQ